MDLREAAEALGVHYQTAYAWVREGTLPARKVGRGYEVSDDGVRALAARRRQGHEPPWPIHVRDWAAQEQALYAAITGGEETRARHQVERLASGVRIVDLCEQVVATPPGERHGLPALMAAACLREDRWLVHHLASDLPAAEVARLADQADASLVVLSSATDEGARRAQEETRFVAVGRPDLNVLAGRSGDSLRDLLARAVHPPAAGREPRA